jgi:hypothetical protein
MKQIGTTKQVVMKSIKQPSRQVIQLAKNLEKQLRIVQGIVIMWVCRGRMRYIK